MTLEEILAELRILHDSASADYDKKDYRSYVRYLKDYNALLKAVQNHELAESVSPIEGVTDGQKSYTGIGFSDPEIAKHREIVVECKKLISKVGDISPKVKTPGAFETLEMICVRFHNVVRQLRVRHANRTTLSVNDEYDVQDLLHSMLKIFYDDVRTEETTPSYAGGSKRMDFLLKNEKVVVEVKKTRDSLEAKEVGEQLIVDITTYKSHPDCKSLICFVYDPEGRIGNPIGLENDLNMMSSSALRVKVLIFPK